MPVRWERMGYYNLEADKREIGGREGSSRVSVAAATAVVTGGGDASFRLVGSCSRQAAASEAGGDRLILKINYHYRWRHFQFFYALKKKIERNAYGLSLSLA